MFKLKMEPKVDLVFDTHIFFSVVTSLRYSYTVHVLRKEKNRK